MGAGQCGIKKAVKIPVITVGAHDVSTAEKALQKGKAAGDGVVVHLGWRLDEVSDRAVVCRDEKGQRLEIEADTVVLATGLVARTDVAERFKGLAPEVYIIGGCLQARKIYHCFEDAWRAVLQI